MRIIVSCIFVEIYINGGCNGFRIILLHQTKLSQLVIIVKAKHMMDRLFFFELEWMVFFLLKT